MKNCRYKRTLKKELSKYDAVIITGGSSGIGQGFVELIDEITHLKLCNISRSNPTYISDRKDYLNVQFDLQKVENISEILPEIFNFISYGKGKSPKILLINNSGFGAYGDFPSPSLSRNNDMVDLNIKALISLCGHFLDVIKQGQGSIINIASTGAFQACPVLSVYAATKAFVKSFSLSLSYELKPFGCKCLCVCPGPTSSNFFKSAGFDNPPLDSNFGHKPFDVALVSLLALSKGKSLVTVGFFNNMQTFIVRLLPTGLMLNIAGYILNKVRTL